MLEKSVVEKRCREVFREVSEVLKKILEKRVVEKCWRRVLEEKCC